MTHRYVVLFVTIGLMFGTTPSNRIGAQSNKPILTLEKIPLVKGQVLIEALGEQRARIRLGNTGQIVVTAPAFTVGAEDGKVQLMSVGDAETIASGGTKPIVGAVIVTISKGSATLELFLKQVP